MAATRDALLNAADGLEEALADERGGQGQDWARRMNEALTAVEQAIGKRFSALWAPDGKLVPVDRPRLPSPTVDRRADDLRQVLHGCLGEVKALRTEVQGASEGLGLEVKPGGLAGALPVAPEAGAVADLGVFVQRAEKLVRDLRHYVQEEALLILEGVNTDIGAPD